MQIVANCIVRHNDSILLLQKPRRGWWVAPGGKVETGESVQEAVVREFEEETGLVPVNPELRGVFTVIVEDSGQIIDHWMLFTFYTDQHGGTLKDECEEGELEWAAADTVTERPMAEGDRIFLQHILKQQTLITGKFTYNKDNQLLEWKPEHGVI
jgi:8-oxo-dGTP diphosphatase